MGEAEPFHVFSITHGVCGNCLEAKAYLDDQRIRRGKKLADFYTAMMSAVKLGRIQEASELLQGSLELGLEPIDLILGLIQPALYEVGDLWGAGSLGIDGEHRFSAKAQELIHLIIARYLQEKEPDSQEEPVVLLVNAEGNTHTLGIQTVEFYLKLKGVPSYTVYPGIPSGEIVDLVERKQPKILAMSIALKEQAECVRDVAEAVERLRDRLDIVVGGLPIRQGLKFEASLGIQANADVKSFCEFAASKAAARL